MHVINAAKMIYSCRIPRNTGQKGDTFSTYGKRNPKQKVKVKNEHPIVKRGKNRYNREWRKFIPILLQKGVRHEEKTGYEK